MRTFLKGETTKDRTIEWFCTFCKEPIEERTDTAIEAFCCSNKKCINHNTVFLMPKAIFLKQVDCRDV